MPAHGSRRIGYSFCFASFLIQRGRRRRVELESAVGVGLVSGCLVDGGGRLRGDPRPGASVRLGSDQAQASASACKLLCMQIVGE